jgi:hypothetical protein
MRRRNNTLKRAEEYARKKKKQFADAHALPFRKKNTTDAFQKRLVFYVIFFKNKAFTRRGHFLQL